MQLAVIPKYELAFRLRMLPELGQRKLADIELSDLLELMERLSGEGSFRLDDPEHIRALAGDLPARPPDRRRVDRSP